MLCTPIGLESLDNTLLLETATFAIHALYTEFIGRCTWLFQFICALAPFLPRYYQFHNEKALYSSWLDDNVWSRFLGLGDVWTMSGNCSFLSRSAWSVHSLACYRMPCFFVLLVGIFVVPSLRNGVKVMPVFPLGYFFLRSNSSMWARSRKTVWCSKCQNKLF